jgi:hypothetical protein
VKRELKAAVIKRLEEKSGGKEVKTNAVAQHVDLLLKQWLAEDADPSLAQKRLIEGTFLEDLTKPRKRTPGRRMDGNC